LKNSYVVSEHWTIVELLFKKATRNLFIDHQDFEKVNEGANSWNIYTDRQGFYYARGDKASGQALAHKLLFDIPKGCKLEWINGNTLDLRRENLNMVQPDGTVVPLLIPEPVLEPVPEEEPYTHTSDVRGVYFHKVHHKWHASAFHGGKRYSLGYQSDTPEGKAKAEELMNEFRANGPKVKEGAN